MKHKHCEVIKAWAEGAEIEYRLEGSSGPWKKVENPSFFSSCSYRAIPKKVVEYAVVSSKGIPCAIFYPEKSEALAENTWLNPQGFLKRTRSAIGVVLSFEFVPE
jgi:hypothetical protein